MKLRQAALVTGSEIVELKKNGVVVKGIKVRLSGHICCVIYEPDIEKCETVEQLNELIEKAKSNTPEVPEFTAEFMKENVRWFLQKEKPREELKTFEYMDMWAVFYVQLKTGVAKLTKELYNELHKSCNPVLVAAKNTAKALKHSTMLEKIAELSGEKIPEEMKDSILAECPFVIITTDKNTFGSAALLDTDYLETVCDDYDAAYLILFPSSIHEVLFIPQNTMPTPSELERYTKLVKEVNESAVVESELLSDKVFVFNKTYGFID